MINHTHSYLEMTICSHMNKVVKEVLLPCEYYKQQ